MHGVKRRRQHDLDRTYPHSESTFPQSRKILEEILAGVPENEQAKPAPHHDRGSPAPTPPACTILTWRD